MRLVILLKPGDSFIFVREDELRFSCLIKKVLEMVIFLLFLYIITFLFAVLSFKFLLLRLRIFGLLYQGFLIILQLCYFNPLYRFIIKMFLFFKIPLIAVGKFSLLYRSDYYELTSIVRFLHHEHWLMHIITYSRLTPGFHNFSSLLT